MDSLLIIFIAAYIIFFMKSKLNEKDRELQNKISPPTSRDFWEFYKIFYPNKRNDDTLAEFLNSVIRVGLFSMQNDLREKKFSMIKEYMENEISSFPDVDISGYFHIHQEMSKNNQNFFKFYLEGYVYELNDNILTLSPFPFLSKDEFRLTQYYFYSSFGNIDIYIPDEYIDKFKDKYYVKLICEKQSFSKYGNSSDWYLKLYLSEVID